MIEERQRMRLSEFALEEEIPSLRFFFEINEVPQTAIVYDEYENGQLALQMEVKDGLSHGKSERWYATGALKEEGYFEKDMKEGVWKEYYPSGQLKRETNYQHSSIDYQRHWNEAGALIEELKTDLLENFKNTKATVKRWYDSGELKEELHADCGIVMDKKEWDKTGALINHYTFTSLDENTLYI